MEKPSNSEHQEIYSCLRSHYRVGNQHALMPRGSKRRSGRQSCPGRKEISLDGRNGLSRALEARLIGRDKFGMGWTLGFSTMVPRDIHDSQNCDEVNVGRRRTEADPRDVAIGPAKKIYHTRDTLRLVSGFPFHM
jgi:hypothetical protein